MTYGERASKLKRFFESMEAQEPGAWTTAVELARRWESLLGSERSSEESLELLESIERAPNVGSAWEELRLAARESLSA